MLLFGYFFTLAIGASLSIFGSGGSLLALPIFIYFFAIPPLKATTYSLGVVFIGALFSFFLKKKVSTTTITKIGTFALPATLMVILTKTHLTPLLPEKISLHTFEILQAQYLVTLFSCIGIFASYSMLKKKKTIAVQPSKKLLSLYGATTGILTAVFGSGGGFIIVPVLRRYAGMNLNEAVSTSLIMVILTSFVGLSTSLLADSSIDIKLLIKVSVLVILGAGIGNIWGNRLKEHYKEKILGYLILIVSLITMLIQYI